MAVSKITLKEGSTIKAEIDLTQDTATAEDVAQGKFFHLANGERVEGTGTGGGANKLPETVDKRIETITYADLEDATFIGNSLFAGCTHLTSVQVPSSVKSIGREAFQGCSALTSLTIDEGLERLEYGAFDYCEALTNVILPDSIKFIGSYAFSNCFNLTQITLGTGLTTMEGSVFTECEDLTDVYFHGTIERWNEKEFEECFNGVTQQITIHCTDGVTYVNAPLDPMVITYINGNTQNITVTKTLHEIQTYPLNQAQSNIAGVVFPEGVKSIPSYMFSTNCNNLRSVTFPTTLKTIGIQAFANTGISTLSFPAKLKSIGQQAFSSCSSLSSVTFNEGLETIGFYAFMNCSNLMVINIPSSVKTLDRAFQSCSSINEVTIGDSENKSALTSINGYCFAACSNLHYITLWAEEPPVITDNNSLFEYNRVYYVPAKSVTRYKTASNWSQYASQIQAIPDSYTDISYFTYVPMMGGITGLSSAGQQALQEGTLTDLVFSPYTSDGAQLRFIDSDAFKDILGIQSVVFPEGVNEILSDAFNGCADLTVVELPSTVTSIGRQAFKGCSSLESIRCPRVTPPTLGDYAFDDTNSCPIGVPQAGISNYEVANNWSQYADRLYAYDREYWYLCGTFNDWSQEFDENYALEYIMDSYNISNVYLEQGDQFVLHKANTDEWVTDFMVSGEDGDIYTQYTDMGPQLEVGESGYYNLYFTKTEHGYWNLWYGLEPQEELHNTVYLQVKSSNGDILHTYEFTQDSPGSTEYTLNNISLSAGNSVEFIDNTRGNAYHNTALVPMTAETQNYFSGATVLSSGTFDFNYSTMTVSGHVSLAQGGQIDYSTLYGTYQNMDDEGCIIMRQDGTCTYDLDTNGVHPINGTYTMTGTSIYISGWTFEEIILTWDPGNYTITVPVDTPYITDGTYIYL